MFRLFTTALFLCAPAAVLFAQQPTDQNPPSEQPDEPIVMGGVEHVGWGLQGAQGRHYFFGGTAIADYMWQGKHRIVTLAKEDSSEQTDPKFLYYRELGDGHRWSVARSPDKDRTYGVYFQPRNEAAITGKAKFTLFHRAKLIEDSRFPEDRRGAAADTRPQIGGGKSPRTRSGPLPADIAPRLMRQEIVVEPDVACCGR